MLRVTLLLLAAAAAAVAVASAAIEANPKSSSSSSSPLHLRWRVRASGNVEITPVVTSDGKYTLWSQSDGIAVRSAASGALASHFTTQSQVYGHPLVVGNRVFFGDRVGNAYALSMDANGQLTQLWSNTSSNAGSIRGRMALSPDGRILYVPAMNMIVALHADTGAFVWQRSGDSANYQVGLLIDGNNLLIPSDVGMTALTLDRGKLVWETPWGSIHRVACAPVLVQGVLYGMGFEADGGGVVWAVRARDGRILWTNNETSAYQSYVAVSNGVIYGSGDWVPRTFFAISTAGRTLWKVTTPHGAYSAPAIVGSTLVFCDFGGAIRGINASTGAQVWDQKIGSNTVGGTYSAELGTLFVATIRRG
jgi:outer membrane protein assembly factor BamB